MSTMPWGLRAARPGRPAVAESPAGDTDVSDTDELGSAVPPEAARRGTVSVLAATLPALLLLGLCVAGLSDPPDAPASGTGSVSRLHVPMQDPPEPDQPHLGSIPLHR